MDHKERRRVCRHGGVKSVAEREGASGGSSPAGFARPVPLICHSGYGYGAFVGPRDFARTGPPRFRMPHLLRSLVLTNIFNTVRISITGGLLKWYYFDIGIALDIISR